MPVTEQIITTQDGRMQTAGSSRTSTPPIDSLSSTGIDTEIVTRLRPAVLEDASPSFPLASQSRVDAIGDQIISVGADI